MGLRSGEVGVNQIGQVPAVAGLQLQVPADVSLAASPLWQAGHGGPVTSQPPYSAYVDVDAGLEYRSFAGSWTGVWAYTSTTTASKLRVTTTDGVASGDAAVVGGRLSASVADSTALPQLNSYASFDTTYAVPASTLTAGKILKIRAVVRISTLLNGGATAQVKLRIGGTDIIASAATTGGSANVRVVIDAELTARAAPGATAAISGVAWAASSDTVAKITVSAPTGVPTFATNGALTIDVQAQSSATGDGSGRLVLEQLNVIAI